MNIEYDSETDCAFIWLAEDLDQRNQHPDGAIKTEIWPKELKDKLGVLFGQDDKILGFELLLASNFLQQDILIDTYSKKNSKKT